MKNENKFLSRIFETFNALDEWVQPIYSTRLLCGVLMLIISLVVAVLSRNAVYFLVGFVCAFAFICLCVYQILVINEGKAIKVEGKCTKIYIPPLKRKWERKYILLVTLEGITYKIYDDRLVKIIDIGNTAALYVPPSAIYEDNKDTCHLNSVYCYSIISSNGAAK